MKKCESCKGAGETYISCCGIDMEGLYADYGLCPSCKEHCEPEECDVCEGSGYVCENCGDGCGEEEDYCDECASERKWRRADGVG